MMMCLIVRLARSNDLLSLFVAAKGYPEGDECARSAVNSR